MLDVGIFDVTSLSAFKTTALHIDGSSFHDTDGTIYDKGLWDDAPHHTNHPAVNDWTQDVAATQPKSVCDQWTADEWNEWADKWENIPACGENASPEHHELQPLAHHEYQDSSADQQLAVPVVATCSGSKQTVKPTRAAPGHMVMCMHAVLMSAAETLAKGGDVETFKQRALDNAGAATPVGKELLKLHVFSEERSTAAIPALGMSGTVKIDGEDVSVVHF